MEQEENKYKENLRNKVIPIKDDDYNKEENNNSPQTKPDRVKSEKNRRNVADVQRVTSVRRDKTVDILKRIKERLKEVVSNGFWMVWEGPDLYNEDMSINTLLRKIDKIFKEEGGVE